MSRLSFTRALDYLKVRRLASINYYDLSPDFVTRENTHEYWEFVYVDGGEVRCVMDGETVLMQQGDIIFHSPEEMHETLCNGKQVAAIFSMIFDCSSRAMQFFAGKKIKVPKTLRSLLKKLIDEAHKSFAVSEYPLRPLPNAPQGGEQLVRIYLEEFLLLLHRHCQSAQKTKTVIGGEELVGNALIEDICACLKANIYGKMSLQMLSDKFHFGKSYLCDQFKKSKGVSVIGYYLELKLEEAKRLLREENIPIHEISEKLGFESPEYFSRYFRKRVGHSPKDFRNILISDHTVRKML